MGVSCRTIFHCFQSRSIAAAKNPIETVAQLYWKTRATAGSGNNRLQSHGCKTVVGVRGFEPPTPASRTQYSTRLSYTLNYHLTAWAAIVRRKEFPGNSNFL